MKLPSSRNGICCSLRHRRVALSRPLQFASRYFSKLRQTDIGRNADGNSSANYEGGDWAKPVPAADAEHRSQRLRKGTKQLGNILTSPMIGSGPDREIAGPHDGPRV